MPRHYSGGMSVAAVLSLAALLGAAVAYNPVATAVGVVAIAVMVVLYVVPTEVLPASALVLYVLVPVGYLPGIPQVFSRFWTPAVLLLAVWIVRALFESSWTLPPERLRMLAVIAVLLLGGSFIGIDRNRSLSWSAVLMLALCVATARCVSPSDGAIDKLKKTWIRVALLLGLTGVLEGVVGRSPLAAVLVAGNASLAELEAGWGVHRIITTMGHPLVNGVYFAVSTTMCFFWWVQEGRRTELFSSVACLGSVAFTGSRGAMLGTIVGICIVLLSTLRNGGARARRTKLSAIFVCVALGAALQSPVLVARLQSGDASSSDAYRETVLHATWQIIRERNLFVGSGPGTSQRFLDVSDIHRILESSVLQVLVSLSIAGACVLFGYLGFLCATSGKLSIGTTSGFVAFVCATAFYNAWESNVAIFALLALVRVASDREIKGPIEARCELGLNSVDKHARFEMDPRPSKVAAKA